MMFSEQLKNQLNIVDVIGHYVRLKRQGSGPSYVGLCPFHSDKSPSLSVHGGLQFYKCFACDAGGDVFKFVQDLENLTFPETLKLLADRYGIPIPERQTSQDPEVRRNAALLEMHEIAAEIFQNNLRGSSGSQARQYLAGRQVSQAAADEFRLGLSDPGGQQLAQRLARFGANLVEESGLVLKRADGSGFYDRFRGRLMFPIHNESGKVIGFGGRALRAGEEPKYLNSPETKIYKKSLVLFNLHRAKAEARKNNQMILVEGYMDVIGVYSSGIHEVVASSGTSLSLEQVKAIKRQVSLQQAGSGQIILNLDSDAAGIHSTEKHLGILISEGLRVKVLQIPGGLDPDEFIAENGTEAYRNLLDKAPSYFQWLADHTRSKFDMHSAEGRTDAFKSMVPILRLLHDPVERATISRELAEYLNIDRDIVRDTLKRTLDAHPKIETQPRQVSSALPPNEKLLLACLLVSCDARTTVVHFLRNTGILSVMELKAIFQSVLVLEDEGSPFSLDRLCARLEPRLQQIVTELSFAEGTVREEDAPEQAMRCLVALESKEQAAKRADLRRQIQALEKQGDLQGALSLINEYNKLGPVSSRG
jgi:DNA primase